MAEEFVQDTFTLVDEKGREIEFVLVERAIFEGNEYFALTPTKKHPDFEEGEFTILRLEPIEGTEDANLVSIEDDEEFDRVADFFEDLLFDEVDYDEK